MTEEENKSGHKAEHKVHKAEGHKASHKASKDDSISISKVTLWQIVTAVLAIVLIGVLYFDMGCAAAPVEDNDDANEDVAPAGNSAEGTLVTTTTDNPAIKTFQAYEGEICTEDGKPIVRLFSTTWCPHCSWIGDTFESVVQEYVDSGDIVAYHWELDINDDTLTEEVEGSIPDSEKAIYQKFNPRGSIPTFVFGCKYGRIGNGYEQANDLDSEAAEFKAIIEDLIANS